MKKLKYLLFLFIIFFIPSVFALDYNVSSTITAPTCTSSSNCSGGHYTALENYEYGIQSVYNINTRYTGRLSEIRFNIPLPNNWPDGDCFATGDLSYTLTLNMATNDWRNNFSFPFISSSSSGTNWAISNVNFVSRKKIYFNFKIPNSDSCIDFLYVRLYSTDISDTFFTGDSNWNLSSIVLSTNSSSTSGGSSGGSSGGTTSSNQDIINNNNDNTNNIINNNNDNTNNIIENNNNNTQQIIENQQNLLGNCVTNLMSNSDIISLDNLYQSGNNFQQITADTNPTLSLSLQAYNNGTYLYNIGETQTITSTKTYTFRFTKSSDFNQIKFKLNGTVRDTGLMINVSSLNDDHIYYISADFFRITQGDIRFNRLIIKENSSLGFAPWGETICLSKLDDVQGAIQGGISGLQDAIDQKTQEEIESQTVCNTITITKNNVDNSTIGSYFNSAGTVVSDSGSTNWGITNFIDISNVTRFVKLNNAGNLPSICFYNSSKTLISCSTNGSVAVGSISVPNNSAYFRASINLTLDRPQYEITTCKNGNQAISDSLTDSNIDNGTGSNFFDNFTSQDFGLSQIITIPLNTIQSLTSKTCAPLQVPIPFTNSNVSLPCMTEIYTNKFPSIYNLWKIVSFGIIAYLIAIDIFHIVKGFKDPESDKVEVLDL